MLFIYSAAIVIVRICVWGGCPVVAIYILINAVEIYYTHILQIGLYNQRVIQSDILLCQPEFLNPNVIGLVS